MREQRETSCRPVRERLPIATARERWPECAALDHETLAAPLDFGIEDEHLIVTRLEPDGRPVAAGRVPVSMGSALFLQASAALTFWNGHGLWLDESDLLDSRWSVRAGVARLALSRTPAGARSSGVAPAPSDVLGSLLLRLFARRGRVEFAPAAGLMEQLKGTDAARRRPEFWLSTAYRALPGLGRPELAPARLRTVGYSGSFLRDAGRRALTAKARAILSGRHARVFSCAAPLRAGSALAFEETPRSLVEAVRWLRERHERESAGRRAVWIAVEPHLWDRVSRRAYATACRALASEVEAVEILTETPPPRLADQWRREVSVPCGTIGASLRFYERLAECVREAPRSALSFVRSAVSSRDWAGFAGDATGDTPPPLPDRGEAGAAGPLAALTAAEGALLSVLAAVRRPIGAGEVRQLFPRPARALASLEARGCVAREPDGGWRSTVHPAAAPSPGALAAAREVIAKLARTESDPSRKVELLLAGGDVAEAIETGRQWFEGQPEAPMETWFEVSARLVQAAAPPIPPWLALLEAERDASGGRLEEAQRRLVSVEGSAGASPSERRRAGMRCVEVQAARGKMRSALSMASAWRSAFPGAPSGETVRVLRVEATCRAREGEHAAALRLLDQADRLAVSLALAERLENALVRADVLSLQGRFAEEAQVYETWRPALARWGDETLMARLLAREALGLNDRREFAAAAARLEQARDVLRDDPVGRARVLIDLAATLYHSGRPARCDALLEEAIACAALAGREDFGRIARGNRLEIWINRCEWEAAGVEAEALASTARSEGDDLRLLVALHQGSRLALRLGHLERAARENEQARSLAERLSDRLEIGELWLEEGDRLVYAGLSDAAREAYARAAADPPDRCDTETRARERLGEMDAPDPDATPAAAAALEELFARDEYAAAESAARRHAILAASGVALGPAWRMRAETVLRSRGGGLLADRVFGVEAGGAAAAPHEALRALRLAVASALAGETADPALPPLGLEGLRILDDGGRELALLGRAGAGCATARRRLQAGSATYELELWPPPDAPTLETAALLLETLLFRFAPPTVLSEHSRGWLRLGIVTADASMEEPYRRLCLFSAQPVTVLVLGESGTGKEAVARAVHSLSSRAAGAFVAVNVAAIPAPLLESELFGHARGAFTGAERERRGMIEEASGGTIFFDEIGDLDLALQAKLLRALQEGEIRRVGESRPRRVDVRIVSATARDLSRDVQAGRFREDLYYRLHVAVIPLPPLRRRGKDVLLLARHFLQRFAREYARGSLQFAPEALAAIGAHVWPGNVRELQNAVAQSAALAPPDGVVPAGLLPEPVRRSPGASGAVDYRSRVDAHRRDLICEALERTGGNRSRAARDLGLSRQALLYLIRELKIAAAPRAAR